MKNKIKILLLAISAIALSNAAMAQTPWSGVNQSGDSYRFGNVGIGTGSPAALLDVNGGFSHFTYNSSGSVLAPSNGAGGLSIGWNRMGGGNAEVNFYNVYDNAPTSFLFSQKTGASTVSDLLSIKSNGNIGIGTSTPEKSLHIKAPGDARIRLEATPGGANSQKWDVVSSGGGLLNSGYFGIVEVDVNVARFIINNSGNVGIGIAEPGNYKLAVSGQTRIGTLAPTSTHGDAMLAVDGKMVSKSIYVTQQNWADFVFDKDYQLPKLSEIETYYKANGHLPLIPTALEVKENGVDLGEMNKLLLQKVEELTILLVEQEKRIEKLESKK